MNSQKLDLGEGIFIGDEVNPFLGFESEIGNSISSTNLKGENHIITYSELQNVLYDIENGWPLGTAARNSNNGELQKIGFEMQQNTILQETLREWLEEPPSTQISEQEEIQIREVAAKQQKSQMKKRSWSEEMEFGLENEEKESKQSVPKKKFKASIPWFLSE